MEQVVSETKNRWVKVFVLLVFVFLGTIASGLIHLFVFSGKEDIATLKAVQSLASILLFLLPALLVAFIWYKNPVKAYSMNRIPTFKLIFYTVGLMLLLLPFINLLGHINEQLQLPESLSAIEKFMKETDQKATEFMMKFLVTHSIIDVFINLVVIALLPALCEEIFFRGSLFRIFRSQKSNPHTLVWIVAIVFSLIHFQMYGFLPLMILGALLGYLMMWSNSIWLPIIAHFTNNAMAVIIFACYKGDINTEMENMEPKYIWILGIISLFISGFVLMKVKRELYKTTKPVEYKSDEE